MKAIHNVRGSSEKLEKNAPFPSIAVDRVEALLSLCPHAAETPLLDVKSLAPVSQFWVKDERSRMNLGSFKALGAAYVIARHASELNSTPDKTTLEGRTYVTASAGNHGMSVAAGARVFGAQAVVYVAETVPEGFDTRLTSQGAEVRREGADYAASMAAAQKAAEDNDWILLSDSSWEGYCDLPHTLMEGYLQMAAEAVRHIPTVPTHILLQAGVGGLAGAVAAYARECWGDAPKIIVVEPENAAALQESIIAGKSTIAAGDDSIMGRLDCKEPSHIALNGLARDADVFLTVSDDMVVEQLPSLASAGLETSASGGAGVAAVLNADARQLLGIDDQSVVLAFLSEGPE